MNAALSFSTLVSELLRQGQNISFRPSGSSMTPTIRDGETVLAISIEASNVKRHDIILYQTGQRLIAHRVIAIRHQEDRTLFILQGDAARLPDLPIQSHQILGKVVAVERCGRRINLTRYPQHLYRRTLSNLRRCKWYIQAVWQRCASATS